MKAHKFRRDREELMAQFSQAIRDEPNAEYMMRVFAVRAVLAGGKTADVAQMFQVSPASVSLWVKTADQDGPEALATKPRSGRPRKLSAEQLQTVAEALQRPAHEAGPSYSCWDGENLADYIQRQFHIEMSSRSCARILQEQGIPGKRAQRHAADSGYKAG